MDIRHSLGIINNSSHLQEVSSFDWIRLEHLSPVPILVEFFKLRLCDYLIAICDELEPKQWKGIKIVSDQCSLRMDKTLVRFLISSSLGTKPDDINFSCSNLTAVEKEIIESAMLEIIDNISTKLSSYPTPSQSHEVSHLVWSVADGKLAITIPSEQLINFSSEDQIDYNDPTKCIVDIFASFLVGTTNVSVAHVESMEKGDVVLLTKSSIDHIYLFSPSLSELKDQIDCKIKTRIRRIAQIHISKSELKTIKESEMKNLSKNPLGNFEIEVQAEFHELKMRLQDLISLKNGSTLELDEIAKTEIYLISQGKRIASGQLVVIGDKFAMAIRDVFLDGSPPKNPSKDKFIEPSAILGQTDNPPKTTNTHTADNNDADF